MKLARAFGRWDVDGFLDDLSPQQFEEWYEAYQLDPWGDERADARIALLACALETLAREEPSWRIGDFMPFTELDEEGEDDSPWAGAQSSEEQAEMWSLIAARFE